MYTTVHLGQDSSKISRYLSNTLLDEIENTLSKGESVLLYLNKRGAYNSLICQDCQYLFECQNCDTSQSVHHNPNHLLCHLCTNRVNMPLKCPKCAGVKLMSIGVGTQQIEEALGKYFVGKNIYRFDSDSMRNISSKKNALNDLDQADIIIGTKMITTGFDFEKIGCIGVILVEQELGSPNYDATERAYSNLKQLIGRGNRKSQETTIILQSFIPKNEMIRSLVESNFKDFLMQTLTERKLFSYPPFGEVVKLEYRHPDAEKALTYIKKLAHTLREYNKDNSYIIIPGTSTFKKNNSYHVACLIKGKNTRLLLGNIKSQILHEVKLSVIFS
ncbi:primosomal protein N' [Candidatus Gracilibacteria bacterium]|nr:primosomal protein N' [Candidatus Gracilibacteria bacterium]